jgi:hypothetical protein
MYVLPRLKEAAMPKYEVDLSLKYGFSVDDLNDRLRSASACVLSLMWRAKQRHLTIDQHLAPHGRRLFQR